jgi:hypothetical protein
LPFHRPALPPTVTEACTIHLQRWRHRVNPNISKEKWTAEEDARLCTLVGRHGNSWAEIARRLPGRTGETPLCLTAVIGRTLGSSWAAVSMQSNSSGHV